MNVHKYVYFLNLKILNELDFMVNENFIRLIAPFVSLPFLIESVFFIVDLTNRVINEGIHTLKT